jgi:creatinine amidohydrolase
LLLASASLPANPALYLLALFGACENHGDHMPFGSDFIMPLELEKRLAQKYQNLVILPPVPYGMSSHHKSFLMTMSLN